MYMYPILRILKMYNQPTRGAGDMHDTAAVAEKKNCKEKENTKIKNSFINYTNKDVERCERWRRRGTIRVSMI